MRFADADGPSWRTKQRRRADDIAFLERLRAATLAELEQMLRDHRRAPEWKRVAIQRALRRATAGA